MSLVDRLEQASRRLVAIVALVGLPLALPGIRSSTRPGGRELGRPSVILTPARLLLIGIGWMGATVALWRPLPINDLGRLRPVCLVAGSLLSLGGLGLAIAGRLALGASYNVSSGFGVRLPEGARLVTTGPYSMVRHPMYLGLMLAAVGSLLLYRTWATALFVLELPALLRRARLEDQALGRQFGQRWVAYRDHVPGWWPIPRASARRRGRGFVTTSSQGARQPGVSASQRPK